MIYNSKHVEVKITYNNKTVEVIENYKYVGMLFSSKSGIQQDHLPYTEQCANKAIFTLKKKLKLLKQTPPPITIKLFDSLVCPILEYGSENLEILHLRFLKKTLGVCRQTMAAVYGDLGRFPLQIRIKICCIKYWFKIVNKSDSKIVKKVYNMLFSRQNWVSSLFDILKSCNLFKLTEKSFIHQGRNKKCSQNCKRLL